MEVTVAIPQLHRVRHPHVVDIRVVAQRQVPLVLLVLADHRASSFAVHRQGGLRPCWAGRASFVMLAQDDLVGPCAQGLTPAIRAGKGWRGRQKLAPRCSATQLDARRHAPGQTRRALNDSYHGHHLLPEHTVALLHEAQTHDVKPRHCDLVQASSDALHGHDGKVLVARVVRTTCDAHTDAYLELGFVLVLVLVLALSSSSSWSLPAVGRALSTRCGSAPSRSGCSFLPVVGFSLLVLLWTPLCSRLSGPVSASRADPRVHHRTFPHVLRHNFPSEAAHNTPSHPESPHIPTRAAP